MDYQAAIKDLQDTLVVVAEIQRRQAEVQRGQAEERVAKEQRAAEHKNAIARIDRNLAEITAKLNALIDIVDKSYRRPPQ